MPFFGTRRFDVHPKRTFMNDFSNRRGSNDDIAGLKGVETLGDNYEITVEDLEAAMKKQDVKLQPGDAVLIHTGWGRLYGKENARYVKSCPGIGVKAAEYLAKADPMLIGADNWPVEVAPNPDPKLSLPVHQVALDVNGIHLLENLKLDEMAARRSSTQRLALQLGERDVAHAATPHARADRFQALGRTAC